MLQKYCFIVIFSLGIIFAQTSSNTQDHNIIEIESSGTAVDMKAALAYAQRNAVDMAIGTYIVAESEVNNYVTVKDQVLAKSEGFIKSYQILDKYKEEDGSWTVKIKAQVTKNLIMTDLEALGVLMSQLDNPSIVVFYAPKSTKYNKRYTEQAINQVNRYFTTFRYDVYDLNQLNAMIEDDIALKQDLGSEIDMAQLLAKKLKSDIYVTIALYLEDLDKGKKKAKATAKIFNASTAKLLGTQNGYSDEIRGTSAVQDRNIDQAVKKLMPLLMKQVKGYWSEQMSKGRQFVLLFSNLPKGFKTKMSLSKAIKRSTKESKKISDTEYKVWFQGTLEDLQMQLYEPLKEVYNQEIDMTNRGDRISIFPASN